MRLGSRSGLIAHQRDLGRDALIDDLVIELGETLRIDALRDVAEEAAEAREIEEER